MLKKLAAAAVLAGLAIAAPAQARDGYYRHDRGGDDAAIAIGAGVVGLALGAALASGGRDRDDYYYEDGYYPRGSYYQSYPQYYGGNDSYYYGSYPRGYYRSYPRSYYRGGDRHWGGRGNWGRDRGDYRHRGWGH